jgi:hypothetical protein
MKRQYNRIYEDLFNEYINEFFEERYRGRVSRYFRRRFKDEDEYYYLQEDFMRMIENEIEDVEIGGKIRLRGDAKLFLLTNFHQMIVRPLLLAIISRQIKPLFHREELIHMVRDDVRTIIKFSSEESNDEEISGHAIMRTIDRMWGKLNSSKFEIWG